MSEIRSWDRWYERSSLPDEYGPLCWKKEPTNMREKMKARLVAWPEGAPKQEDVPQAGERVRKGSLTHTVVTGIPYNSGGKWYLQLKGGHSICGHVVGSFKIIPPTPPQTYTEEEIREAVDSSIAGDNFLSGEIIAHLREGK